MVTSNISLDRPVSAFLQPQPVTLRACWTVDEAVAFLRYNALTSKTGEVAGMGSGQQPLYFYVLDEASHLVGVLPARTLLLTPGATALSALLSAAQPLVTLRSDDTLFTACELFAMHRLLAIPVIDKATSAFLGTIDVSLYTDEIFDLAQRKSSDDLFQLIGLHLELTRSAAPFAAYRHRMPWLLCNLAGGLACAALASLFDHVLRQILLLSLFIPIMLTLAESISIQSMTLSLQTLSSKLGGSLRREMVTSLLLAVSSAVLVAAAAWLWPGSRAVPLAIAGAIGLNMVIAAAVGHLVPKFIMHFRLNPTLASGPLVLALADTAAITVYLSVATLTLLHT